MRLRLGLASALSPNKNRISYQFIAHASQFHNISDGLQWRIACLVWSVCNGLGRWSFGPEVGNFATQTRGAESQLILMNPTSSTWNKPSLRHRQIMAAHS